MQRPQKAWPYSLYFHTTLLVAITGIVLSINLANTHYRNYTDITFSSFCAISKTINCDTVAQSPWSVIFDLPIALWGLFGYVFFLIFLLLLRKQNQRTLPIWTFLVLLGGIYSLIALFLGYISAFKIHSYCILCLGSYATNLSLFYMSFVIINRFNSNNFLTDIRLATFYLANNKRFYIAIVLFLLLFSVTKSFLPQYWKFESSLKTITVSNGVTDLGQPWIGSTQPRLTIEVFSDYQCFQCAKTHSMLRRLIEEHPDTFRLVQLHYPMDHEFNPTVVADPFHIGSGKMALLAIYATTQNKFWEMNDALFQLARSKEPFNTRYLAEQTGIPLGELNAALTHPEIRKKLLYDIRKGMKLRITGTPTFAIENKIYQGFVPDDILQAVMK